MKLTNAIGQVVASYTYGTYGELLSGDTSLTHFLYNGRCGVSTDANGLYYMRQCYYNPEIKRFINQDILTGSIDNSQSLNRYCYVQGNPVSYTDPFGLSPLLGLLTDSNTLHTIFGLLGCIPGPIGAAADFADALVYLVIDHDYGMAMLTAMGVLAFGLDGVAKLLPNTCKGKKCSEILSNTVSLMSNGANFGMNLSAGIDTAGAMYVKYVANQKSADSGTIWEVLSLGMSLAGSVISGKGMSKSVSKFADDIKNPKSYCFVAGTLVHTSEGAAAIEDIKLGDYVLAYDEETGGTGYKKVLNLFRNETEELTHVEVTGTEEIICTPGHKFYLEGEWISASELKPGDVLAVSDGTTATVISVTTEKLEEPVTVYNFEVEDWHNYYVADSGILVHNKGCGTIGTCNVPKSTKGTVVGKSGSSYGKGRSGKQKRLLEIANEDKVSSSLRGEIKRDIIEIQRGKRKSIRVPSGYQMAHRRGYEARKGFGYEFSDLNTIENHKRQHKIDGYGRRNK